jgi:predicted glutamine amidotransferase
MCGIAGFIGKSNNPHVSFSLATKLFEGIESRGKDAAGFWGSRDDGDTINYKESIKSSQIVEKDIWNKVRNFNPNILLLHARASSIGVGHASDNVNNHPFISEDNRVAVIHNGFIPEYSLLEEKYETISECDSEIVLRMFDASAGDTEDVISTRMNGLKSFFSYVNYGQMAVAIGEKVNDSSYLWIFRNQHRPLWIIDLRRTLGQIFFCSTKTIWKRAVERCQEVNGFLGSQRLFELPTEELWVFKVSKERPAVGEEDFLKFKIEKNYKENISWDNNVDKIEIRKGEPIGEVFSEPIPDNLNETFKSFEGFKDYSSYDQKNYCYDVNDKCESIKNSISNIKTVVENLSYEQSISESELINLLSSLEQVDWDVTGALKILDNS